jgi:hypothetical protein
MQNAVRFRGEMNRVSEERLLYKTPLAHKDASLEKAEE